MLKQPAVSRGSTQIVARKVSVSETIAAQQFTGYSLHSAMETLTLTQRILIRVREEMARQELSQRDIAAFTAISESKISKIMHGTVELSVEDADRLCRAVNLSPAEAVRDRGMEFCAEMTPTEMRLLELWRAMSKADHDVYWYLMTTHTKAAPLESRRALPQRAVRKRLDGRG